MGHSPKVNQLVRSLVFAGGVCVMSEWLFGPMMPRKCLVYERDTL